MLKLMIVDDEPILLSGIRDMVEYANTAFTRIMTADDAVEALKIMDYFQPDLLITDIQMPEMDGLELIRRAKTKHVKRFIILTGYDLFSYAQSAIRLQVAEYALKPIDESYLTELLKRMAIEVLEQKPMDGDGITQSYYNEEDGHNEHIRQLKAFIHANYMKDISLSVASQYLDLHPVYIGKLFKQVTGENVVAYINQLRVQKAKKLMFSDKNIPLDKIATCVGFEHSRTFYKVFRKYTGQTPGEYRSLVGGHEEELT
ncbi:response regulator [Paenibacillus sp. FSL R5-0517]|uniref:response regulator transcription factor n=1 Tax=Paenibacillus sp. FSL R5-0517 TaxID=2921647 RepID=UPI0030DC3222